MMLKRRLGRTNFETSVLGFGGIAIQYQPWEEAVAAVKRAIELGVNLIDSARGYGDSEDKIGEAIKGQRENLFISTKSHYPTGEEVRRSIDESLAHLGVDRIDLIFMHAVDQEQEFERRLRNGVLDAMRDARRAGKVNYIGISGHQNRVLAKAIRTGEFDVLMAMYNLADDDAQEELFPLASSMDVGITVMKPLGGGYLGILPEVAQFGVAEKAISTADEALRFVLSNQYINTSVVGMGSIAEVEQDIPLGLSPQEMPPEELARLKERARVSGYTFCRGCGYCLPVCEQEIDIREVFRLFVFHEQYGLKELAKERFQKYHEGKVAMCTECLNCTERCPAALDIPSLLKQAASILGSNR